MGLPLVLLMIGAAPLASAGVGTSANVGLADPVRVDYYMESLCP